MSWNQLARVSIPLSIPLCPRSPKSPGVGGVVFRAARHQEHTPLILRLMEIPRTLVLSAASDLDFMLAEEG